MIFWVARLAGSLSALVLAVVLQDVSNIGEWALLVFVPTLIAQFTSYEAGLKRGSEITRRVWGLPK